MTTVSRIIGLILISLLIALTSCSSDDNDMVLLPEPSNTMTSSELTTYFESLIHAENIPGFAVTIVKNDAITFQNGFGFADIQNQKLYTNETHNGIASLSKTFVGAATAKAIEQGYFTLDTPINEVLPVNIVNLQRPEAIILVRHLVTHTSGILDNPENYTIGNYTVLPNQDVSGTGADILLNGIGLEISNPIPLIDYLAEYFMEDGFFYGDSNYLDITPGTTWTYSNVATALMGFVIESTVNQSFDEYVKENIFAPLQMSSSTYDVVEVDFDRMAIPYIDNNRPLPFYGNHGYPEGSVHTTNQDLGKYLLDMTRGIKGQSSTLFAPTYYKLLFTEQLPDGIVPNAFAENHGLYWYTKNGKWMHGGNSLGISSQMEIAEDGSYGFVITSNIDGTFFENEGKWETVKEKIENGIQAFLASN
ncbi:beta-lactamase family protein [Aurantibacter crassamenti]|uniref:serine hydrolase domain-containing protein n=1 Tax=Aurantibacter crassamenti TaxID=1837375 RepID=UPI00193AD840|nr:serine hydrolase domain-containing protein [Aurantibacter crassamenti]MBM1106552.1 beta-lactamase family protein [Aurantibacter crassamenti]